MTVRPYFGKPPRARAPLDVFVLMSVAKEGNEPVSKIQEHDGLVWNCCTGALARLGLALASALQVKKFSGTDVDAAQRYGPTIRRSTTLSISPAVTFDY